MMPVEYNPMMWPASDGKNSLMNPGIVRSLPIMSTITRPASFMEMMLLPGMGLPQGQFTFLMRPEQSMQMIAVDDLGRINAEGDEERQWHIVSVGNYPRLPPCQIYASEIGSPRLVDTPHPKALRQFSRAIDRLCRNTVNFVDG